MASQPIYQFYAELCDYKPKMWRRFQVANNIAMARLGYIIMTLFEMQASHLFCFDVAFEENFKKEMFKKFSESDLNRALEGTSYLSPTNNNWHIEILTEESYEYRVNKNEKLIDALETTVKNVLNYPDDRMIFTYDYGDNWQVSVVLEKIIVDKELPGKELPRVFEGEGFSIIEDCGGTSGLEDIAKTFQKKKGKQYAEYCDWLGRIDLDLLAFDIDDMNFRLKKIPGIYADAYEYGLEPTKRSLDLLERKYKSNRHVSLYDDTLKTVTFYLINSVDMFPHTTGWLSQAFFST